ncbi:hypothetical protein LCGC14_1984080, partial [marine sediment metagenome]
RGRHGLNHSTEFIRKYSCFIRVIERVFSVYQHCYMDVHEIISKGGECNER